MEAPVRYSRLSDEYGGNMECILDFVGCSNQKSRDGRDAGFTCFIAVKSILRCSKINKNTVSSPQKMRIRCTQGRSEIAQIWAKISILSRLMRRNGTLDLIFYLSARGLRKSPPRIFGCERSYCGG